MGNFNELEGGFVKVALELFVAIKVTIGLFNDDVPFEQKAFEHSLNVKPGVTRIARSQGDVLQVEEHCQSRIGIVSAHFIVVRVYYAPGRRNAQTRERWDRCKKQFGAAHFLHAEECACIIGHEQKNSARDSQGG